MDKHNVHMHQAYINWV